MTKADDVADAIARHPSGNEPRPRSIVLAQLLTTTGTPLEADDLIGCTTNELWELNRVALALALASMRTLADRDAAAKRAVG